MTLAELFDVVRQKVTPGEEFAQGVTGAEWEQLVGEAFAPGSGCFAPAPLEVLAGEVRLIHPVLRRGLRLTITD